MEVKIEDRRKFMLKWVNMLDRCENPKNKSYHRYGGRGISVCSRWHDFFKYLKDLPEGHFDRAELDRADNNGNYQPDNVGWVTKRQNCINRDSTRFIEFGGVKKCASDWARLLGINVSSLIERLDNWSLEDALTLPKGTRLHNRWDGHTKPEKKPKRLIKTYAYNGKQYTMKELAVISAIPAKLLRKRINERKWGIDRAMSENILSRRECAIIAAKASHKR